MVASIYHATERPCRRWAFVHGHFFARLAALPVTFALTPPPLPIRAPVAALAVGGAGAWGGRGDGRWRVPFAGGAERVALPVAGPVRQVASSADGRVVVAALDGAMLRSDDGGGRFQDIPGAA